MTNPVWAQVGGDPVPVEGAVISALLAVFGATADSASSIRASLTALSGQAGAEVWTGESADAFREKLGDLPVELGKVEASYHEAAVALRSFVGVVERSRSQADALVGAIWTAFDGEHRARLIDPASPEAAAGVDAAARAVQDVRARVESVRGEYARAEAVLVAALAVAADVGIPPDSPWHRFLREVEEWAGVIAVVLLVIVIVALVVLVTVFTAGAGMALFAALLLALETLGPLLTALTVVSATRLAATATRKAQYGDDDTPSWTAIGIEAALILIPVGIGKVASVVRAGGAGTLAAAAGGADELVTATGTGARALTAADRVALADYTGDGFTYLNGVLRGGSDAEKALIQPRVDAISTVLSKLPRYEGTLFRGTNLPVSVIERYVPGAVIEHPAFTSTSLRVLDEFKGNTQFIIDSVNGRQIGALSNFPNESEVLLDAGTKFKVLGRYYDEAASEWKIFLREWR
jgi:hypothetical protein